MPFVNRSGFHEINGTRLECEWIESSGNLPTLVFLHEGLGSVSSWRDFPKQLAALTGLNALVYSRAGYGRSDPATLPWSIHFMHTEAEVLAALLARLEIDEPLLVGHSDGASIALIYAGSNPAARLRALILEAPHVFVEPWGLESIVRIGNEYRSGELRERLRRHHGANTDATFWGWHDVWLHPDFRDWNLEAYLPKIEVPMLLIQSKEDEYGTWRQIDTIVAQTAGPVEVKEIAGSNHSPHREDPQTVLRVMSAFIGQLQNRER